MITYSMTPRRSMKNTARKYAEPPGPGTVALREIRRFQVNLLIPKLPFLRLVKTINAEFSQVVNRWTPGALMTLHEAAEDFLIHWAPSGEDTGLPEGTGEELIMERPEIPETTTFVPGGDSKEVPAKSKLVEDRMPFVKERSSIWEAVESLEVFQALPQRPHFRPLFECKESVREGLAIGHMVTFSQLAEKIQKLRVGDSQEIFHCHLDSLADLETHGFDTTSLVHRLNKLLSIKDKREKLRHHLKKVRTQIVECSRGKAKLKEDIDNIDKKMRKLQEEREKKCDELTALELEAGVTNADI